MIVMKTLNCKKERKKVEPVLAAEKMMVLQVFYDDLNGAAGNDMIYSETH